MPSRAQAAFTLTEVMVAAAVGSVLLGSSTTLYVLLAQRTTADTAANLALAQATQLADEITEVIDKAVIVNIATASGRQYAIATLPNGGADADGDGVMDAFSPNAVSPEGLLSYANGQIIAFHWSNSGQMTEAAGLNSGSHFWRSFSPPAGGATSADTTFSRTNGTPRWNLVESVTWVNDLASRATTFTVTARVRNRDQARPPANTPADQSSATTVTRTVTWRHAPL